MRNILITFNDFLNTCKKIATLRPCSASHNFSSQNIFIILNLKVNYNLNMNIVALSNHLDTFSWIEMSEVYMFCQAHFELRLRIRHRIKLWRPAPRTPPRRSRQICLSNKYHTITSGGIGSFPNWGRWKWKSLFAEDSQSIEDLCHAELTLQYLVLRKRYTCQSHRLTPWHPHYWRSSYWGLG